MWYTIMVTAWIDESHLLKWQKSSIAQNYIELPHFIMRHRQAVRQGTLTPPSQVRLLLAQLDKTPHGCLEHQVSMRGFFVSAFRRIKKRAFPLGGKPFWFAVETGCGSVQLQRAGVQLVVGAVLGDQLVVGAALDDAAVVQDHDGVGVLDGGQPVGDDKGGAWPRCGCRWSWWLRP